MRLRILEVALVLVAVAVAFGLIDRQPEEPEQPVALSAWSHVTWGPDGAYYVTNGQSLFRLGHRMVESRELSRGIALKQGRATRLGSAEGKLVLWTPDGDYLIDPRTGEVP